MTVLLFLNAFVAGMAFEFALHLMFVEGNVPAGILFFVLAIINVIFVVGGVVIS